MPPTKGRGRRRRNSACAAPTQIVPLALMAKSRKRKRGARSKRPRAGRRLAPASAPAPARTRTTPRPNPAAARTALSALGRWREGRLFRGLRFSARSVGWVVGVAVTVLSLGTFGWPRLSASSLTSLDPKNPFATPFTISNDGWLPLYDVTYSCTVEEMIYRGRRLMWDAEASRNEIFPALRMNQKATCQCSFFMRPPAAETNITATLDVSYRPFPAPASWGWRARKRFRFKTAAGADGNLYWLPQPGD
jgi:hypothetical protein